MRKIGIVLAVVLLLVLMTTAVSPSQLAPAQDEFFNIYVTFWSGDLRIFALADNTLVTIRDLDTGEILSLDDPRISDSPAPNFDTNPFVLAEAGDAFEGVGGKGATDQEIRVVIEATDATDPSIPKPILAWTGALAARLRHPDGPEPPSQGQNPWMSYIPGIPKSDEPVVVSRKLGREFLGFTSRELYLFARTGDEDTVITVLDLETNTDADTDDSVTLGPSDAFLTTDEIEIYYLDQFEDDTLRISSSVDVSALAGIASKVADDFTYTPPSYGPDDEGFSKGTLFYTYTPHHVTVFPLEDDTTVTITDLSTGEVSKTVTLANGDTTGPYNFYTPVLWTDDLDYGYMVPRESSPQVIIESNANEMAFDNQFVKVESDKAVLTYVGPVGSDVNEFADMQLAVPDSPTFRTVYTYAQDSGGSNDLQIFARSADTEVTITSLTYTEGFEAQGKEETWHDFNIGPGIGGANGWLKGTADGGVWWGSDIWAGEVLRIQSNLPILVLGGDYDVPHFGAFTPYFAPNLPTITVVKEVKGTDDDTTSFDFTFVDEDFALKNGESKLFEDLVAGTYTITETVPDNWLLTGIECDNGFVETNPDSPQVTVDLRWVEDVVCTFTNEPITGTIKVVKEVKGIDDNTTSFDFTFVDEDFALTNGESKLFEDLVAGTYTITETVPGNWLLTEIKCDNGFVESNPAAPQVTVDLGWTEDVVCTFTNEPITGTIKVVKEVKGIDDNTTVFDFTFVDEDFALTNGESKLFEDLVAGTYTITETVPDNWLLTEIKCDNGFVESNPAAPQVTVDLGWTEDIVCTFTNEVNLSTITVVKEVKGIDDNTTSFDFTFVDEDFALTNGESKLFEDLVAGTYTITETVPDNWLLAEITCDNGVVESNPDPPQVTVDLGWTEDIVCTFTNEIITAVELTSFTAEAGSDRVTLQWQTASEIDNEGFNVWRSESEDGTYTRLNAGLIAARGNADTGASYEYVDTDVVQDTKYYYKLEDVDSHGASALHGPISATPTRIWRIFMPFVTGAIMLPGAVIWQRKNRPS